MEPEVVDFMRMKLKIALHRCNDQQQLLFKRMYSHNALELGIETVVDNMLEEKLNWALQQVKNTRVC